MQYKQLRDLVFPLHRYIGLVVGLIVIVIGLTGSLLVSTPDTSSLKRTACRWSRYSIPSEPLMRIALSGVQTPLEPDVPYEVGLESPDSSR